LATTHRRATPCRRSSCASCARWLYRITTNYCLNLIRDAARRRELLEQQGKPSPIAEEASPEDKHTLRQVLERIPEDLREIAVYYFVDQMNQDEIASIVGVSRRTIGNRLEAFRAAAQAALGGGEASP
jgi:RNA polymerase sigma-70 factor (ECF subfamily)